MKSYVAASKYPKYNRMDEVLFRLAYLLQMIKKEDQAREFFHRLIKDYPQSKYVPNAYLSFAEFYFHKGEMENAGKFYEKVDAVPRLFGVRLRALQEGLGRDQPGQFQERAGDLRQGHPAVPERQDSQEPGRAAREGSQEGSGQGLRTHALAPARTRPGTSSSAWAATTRPRCSSPWPSCTGSRACSPSRRRSTARSSSLNEASPRLCEWQNKILRNTLSGGNKKDQVQELKRLGNVYEAMVKKTDVKKDVMSECKNTFHDTGKELALIWHKEAQRTKNADTYQLAGMVYKEFLSHFNDEKDTPEITFYYGEILWQMASWKEAAETYTKVVELDPKGKYVKESAYAAVLAWKNALNIDDSGEGVDKEQGQREGPEAARDPRVPEEDDRRLRHLHQVRARCARAREDQVPQGARLLRLQPLRRGHQALRRTSSTTMSPTISPSTRRTCLLDCLNILKRYKELLATVEKYLANPVLMKDQEFRKQMVSLKTDSLVAEAKQYEKEKNYKECGISFVAAAETIPDHKDHAQRLYNAGLCFQNARLVGQAIKAREQLIKDHPKDILAQRALFQIASGYHQLAYYSEAAKRYEEFAGKFPGEKQALHRARQRLLVPHRLGRVRQGGRGHEQLRQVLRRQEAGGHGQRRVPDERGLREAEQDRRAGQAPRRLPQEVGRQGRHRQADPRALQAGRDRLEQVLPAGGRERRLHQGRPRHHERQGQGDLRDQQQRSRTRRRS